MAQVQILYLATASGLKQLANPGKSDRWREVGTALDGEDVAAVATSPTDPLTAYATATDGVVQTSDGGATWTTILHAPVVALDVAADGTVLAGTTTGSVLQATGTNWTELLKVATGVVHLAVLGEHMAIVLADGSVHLGQGQEWVEHAALRGATSTIVASDNHPERVFAASRLELLTPDGPRPIQPSASGALALLGGKTETLLVATRGSILRSDDYGATLEPASGPVDVLALVSPAHFLDWAYAGTRSGELWVSKDRGRIWMQLYSGDAAIQDLQFARLL